MKRITLLSLIAFLCLNSNLLFSQCGIPVDFCYGNNYDQVVVGEICPDPGYDFVEAVFLNGVIEQGDALTLYSGPSGSGNTGDMIMANAVGQLNNLAYMSINPGDCIILIVDSDKALSCADNKSTSDIKICGRNSGNSLPVSLASFEAKLMRGDEVLLNWTTASELGNAGFEIQKSTDGRSWETITWIEGYGTTSATNKYQYVDALPFDDMTYYRLKQVDLDGTFVFSEVASVRKVKAAVDVALFPNPAHEEVNITIDNPGKQKMTISIFDSRGAKLQQFEVAQGRDSWTTKLALDTNGVYYLTAQAGNDLVQQKFIVNK